MRRPRPVVNLQLKGPSFSVATLQSEPVAGALVAPGRGRRRRRRRRRSRRRLGVKSVGAADRRPTVERSAVGADGVLRPRCDRPIVERRRRRRLGAVGVAATPRRGQPQPQSQPQPQPQPLARLLFVQSRRRRRRLAAGVAQVGPLARRLPTH